MISDSAFIIAMYKKVLINLYEHFLCLLTLKYTLFFLPFYHIEGQLSSCGKFV